MRYTIGFRIDGRYYVNVEANNLDDAIAKAEAKFEEASLNEMEVIDSEVINARDEKGKFTDFVEIW